MDVDPRIDDAIAIITALKSNDNDIVGITTASGNVNSQIGVLNTRYILNILGRSDVETVIIDGKIVLKNRKLTPIKETDLISDSQSMAKRIAEKSGIDRKMANLNS